MDTHRRPRCHGPNRPRRSTGEVRAFLPLAAAVVVLVASRGTVGWGAQPAASEPDAAAVLPATAPLPWPTPLDVRMREGVHRFIARKAAESRQTRQQFWRRDLGAPAAYEDSVRTNRDRLRQIVGVADPRLPAAFERFGDEANPALVAETRTYRVFQVRWPVLKNIYGLPAVQGEGLLLEPVGKPVACVIAVPDADQTPEQLVGLAEGILPESQFARRLAENGFAVVVPTLASRAAFQAGQTQREWIFRQAFHMGRHVIGYEVQKILGAVEAFERQHGDTTKIGVAGYAEGGLEAFYAAALDPRIDAALVSGYFKPREDVGLEPLCRTVWGLLREFGDAEIASLIAPRGLVIEFSPEPKFENSRGRLQSPPFAAVKEEFDRIAALIPAGFQSRELVCGPDNSPVAFGSPEALRRFAAMLGAGSDLPASPETPRDRRGATAAAERQTRQVRGMEDHAQGLIEVSLEERNRFFLYRVEPRLALGQWGSLKPGEARQRLAAGFVEKSKDVRQYFWREVLGRIDDPYLPPSPRSRRFRDDPKWTAYDVVLDVFPDVFAWGLLLVPKDTAPGDRRPAVVVQPGLECVPQDALERDQVGTWGVAAQLADRGFVVFVPQNLHRGGDDFRRLDKAARAIKASMWSFMLAQHDRILEWLGALPYVDAARLGFYGCSYGGTTAVYVPPILERYCLSICSANFNDWTQMIASTTWDPGYMRTAQWEFSFFNMGNTFSHAEMAYLMAPRPFMVERGMFDGVAYDWRVAMEYAKVRWLYAQLGIEDHTEFECRNDAPHGFLCQGAFDFLHKHLRYPR